MSAGQQDPAVDPTSALDLRIERGRPGPAEIAALTVVLAAASARATPPPPPRRTLWTNRARYARPRPAVGPGGWRASALPR